MKKLAIACLGALSAFAMTGCGDPECDPACGAGYTCNIEVDPPVCEADSPCNPACAAGQTCDTAKNPPVCVTPVNDCKPACGAGYRCDKAVTPAVCVVNECSPACGEGQKCDSTRVPAVCVDKVPCDPGCGLGLECDTKGDADPANDECVCDPGCVAGEFCNKAKVPAQCESFCEEDCDARTEVCDEISKECKPVTCGTNTCGVGEGCFSPTTGAAGGNTCTCLPDNKPAGAEDTCLAFDMVCDYNPKAPKASHCKTPGEWDTCNPNATTPCEAGLDCVDYKGEDGDVYYCMVPCETNTDCGNWTGSYCTPEGEYGAGHCNDNYCSIPELWAGQYTEAQWRSLFFGKCPVNAAGETDDEATWKGTCVPYPYFMEGRYITLGICEEAGNVASGGECDPAAGRENMDLVCGFNNTCIGYQPKTTENPGGGICEPNCNAAPEATALPANTCTGYCYDYTGVDDESFNKTRWGFCIDSCDQLGTDACADDVFGNDVGCTLFGYCWPVTTPAAAIGETCADPTTAGDYRNNCGDRSICIAESGEATAEDKCFGFCDPVACPNTTAAPALCAACGENLYCVDLGDGLGLCYPTATLPE